MMWAYLDTGSARNFISLDAARMLNLKPKRHEPREIVTLNWITKQSMPIYEIEINTLDGEHERKSRLPVRNFQTLRQSEDLIILSKN